MGSFHLKLWFSCFLFFFVFISLDSSAADKYDSPQSELSTLKTQHKDAMTALKNVQKKHPKKNRIELLAAIDEDIKKIENSLSSLGLYEKGIKILNKEASQLKWYEKGAKFLAVPELNDKLKKHKLEINEKADLFMAPEMFNEMYNKYLPAAMFFATVGGGMDIPVAKIEAIEKVKITNLRESGALTSILNSLPKAKKNGTNAIQQLRDQKQKIQNIDGLEKRIADLEKQISAQKSVKQPEKLSKKIKYVTFVPHSRLRQDWPNVPVGIEISLKLIVVYEDGAIDRKPDYSIIKGANFLKLTKPGPYEFFAEVRLNRYKKVYPVKMTIHGKPPKGPDVITSPHNFRNPIYAKETSGQIQIPLRRKSNDIKDFNVFISVNRHLSTAKQELDYKLRTKQINWNKHEKVRHVIIDIIDDNQTEGTEKIILKARLDKNVGETHEIIVYIVDDERGGVLGFSNHQIKVPPEKDKVKIGIERKGMSSGEVSVEFSTHDGTAKKGEQYIEKKEKISWKESDKDTQFITIDLKKHKRDKERAFWAVLKKPTNGATLDLDSDRLKIKLLKGSQTAVQPTPAGPSQLGFAKNEYKQNESQKVATVYVTRTGDSSVPVSVNWKIYDGSTDMNKDYISDFGKLEWPKNNSDPREIRIKIIDDKEPERLEYAYIELYNPQSAGQTVEIKGTNPSKLVIIDNDINGESDTEQKQLTCQSIKIRPDRIKGEPGQTFRLNQTFRVIALMSDNSEIDVTQDPLLVWDPGPQVTFPDESSFNERIEIKARFMDCRAGARIDVEYPFWSDPISDADDLTAKVPLPPADAYVWYVACNRKTLDVVYTKHIDLTRHMVIEGPFPGPRTADKWIADNCPRAKCDKNGSCSQNAAVRGGPWGVYCNIKTGLIVVTKSPQVHHRKYEDNFHSSSEAELWSEQKYPSGLCDNMGRYMEEGFGEISSRVGNPSSNRAGNNEFAEIGSKTAQRVLQESTDANVMSQGGKRGFSLHNFDNAMGPEFKKKKEAQEREAQAFLKEFLTRTTRDFYEYEKKKAEQKRRAQEIRNQNQASNENKFNKQIHPVGPNWNPVDGWGKPGQVSKGAVKCPDNQNEKQRKCAQANEYARKYASMGKSSNIWAANLQRANAYLSQCCGVQISNNQPSANTGSGQGKNVINELKCKNAKQYLNNAVQVKNIRAAREILNEIRNSGCDYYDHARNQVDKLERLIAKNDACEHYGNQLREALRRKDKQSAKALLAKYQGCPNYEMARAKVNELESKPPCRPCEGLQAVIVNWSEESKKWIMQTNFGDLPPVVSCKDPKQSHCIDQCNGKKICYETIVDKTRRQRKQR